VTVRIGRRVPAAPLHGDHVVVRAATLDDAEMLVRWHLDPDVMRFWDGRTFTNDEMAARLTRPHVDAYIVEADGEAVGYLQAWFGDTVDVGGLDMFLIPTARGRSLGPDAARTLAKYLITHAGCKRITVDPYLWNERAIRGWLKACFCPVQEHEPDHEHRDRWLLMEFVVAEAASI
jgi:aminoglycoside 6'-N-acetyltransferase